MSLQNGLPKAQWINPQNFHVTLSFFGEVENTVVDELIHAFDTIKCPPFSLRSSNFEVFNSEAIPHSLVVHTEPCETLSLLHEKMQCIRNHLGLIPDEAPFTPHITLARLTGIKPGDLSFYLSSRGGFSLTSFEVDHFVLLLSTNPSSDATYVVKGWILQE